MKKLLFITAIFFFYTGTALIGFARISFQGNAPQAIVVGEQFYINYVLSTAGERGKNLRLQGTKGLKILSGPNISGESSFATSINGKISTQIQITFTYILMAEKEGEWTVPGATIKVGNSEYKSNELTIKALPSGQSNAVAFSKAQTSSDQSQTELSYEDIFVQAQVSKSSVYENEGFLVTFKLYSSIGFGVDNIKYPDFEGFIVQEIELPENRRQVLLENHQGRNYRTVILKQVILYPQHTGKMTIGKGKYDVIVRLRNNQSQRMHSFFDDDLFDIYSNVKKTLISPPISIDVKSLPSRHPASFSGAVGEYQMTSSISTTKLKINEPITVKIALSGNGNIKMIKNPTIAFPNDFELYDPKVEVHTKVTPQGVNGTKNIEYYAVPRYSGDFVIPSVQFTYFDLKIKSYRTFSTEEYHLHIEPGENNHPLVSSTINNSIQKEEIRFLGQDIHYIKTSGFTYQKKNFFFGSLQYWLCYLFPIVLFLILWISYHKKVQENANINLVRTKKAYRVAIKKLKFAQLYLKDNQKGAFYEEILKTVWGYLSDKWIIPISDLTKDNVETELIRYGVQEELIKKFISILHAAEFAHYSPSQNDGIESELYQQTIESIQQMEKYNFSKR